MSSGEYCTANPLMCLVCSLVAWYDKTVMSSGGPRSNSGRFGISSNGLCVLCWDYYVLWWSWYVLWWSKNASAWPGMSSDEFKMSSGGPGMLSGLCLEYNLVSLSREPVMSSGALCMVGLQ
jgi:hypothetical protein